MLGSTTSTPMLMLGSKLKVLGDVISHHASTYSMLGASSGTALLQVCVISWPFSTATKRRQDKHLSAWVLQCLHVNEKDIFHQHWDKFCPRTLSILSTYCCPPIVSGVLKARYLPKNGRDTNDYDRCMKCETVPAATLDARTRNT